MQCSFPDHPELASQNITPEFELVYNTAEEYGLKDLSPQSYADLVERWVEPYMCQEPSYPGSGIGSTTFLDHLWY